MKKKSIAKYEILLAGIILLVILLTQLVGTEKVTRTAR